MGKAYGIGGTMFVRGFLGLILSGALFILADGSWKAPIENSPLKFLGGIARDQCCIFLLQ